MILDDVQLAAKRRGELVYAMDQGQTAMLTQPGPWGHIQSGFCAGLAVRWRSLRHENKDYPYDPRTLELETPDWQATRDHNIGKDAHKTGADAYDAMLRQYGMSINPGRISEREGAASGYMLRAAAEAAPGCYFVSLRGARDSHAIAMQNESGHLFRLFDANKGEFVLKGANRFGEFLDEFLADTLYRLAFPNMAVVFAVNPPAVRRR